MSSSSDDYHDYFQCHGSNTSLDVVHSSDNAMANKEFDNQNHNNNNEGNDGLMLPSTSATIISATPKDCTPELATGRNEGNNDITQENEAEMAIYGIHCFLNDGLAKAMDFFDKHKQATPLMNAGYSFVIFMYAAISMDEVKLSEAVTALEDTQKMCETNTSFMRSVKSAFRRLPSETSPELSPYEKYQRQILIADALFYQASLIISIQQDIPGFIRGGWMLRKSQKLFDRVRKELGQVSEKKCSDDNFRDGNANRNLSPHIGLSHSSSDGAISQMHDRASLSASDATRLMGALSFGYGLLQLCVSMLPPKIMRVISFLGFEGDRKVGLEAMEYASYSADMKAPIAMLGLLWYNTIIRQSFSIDASREGVDKASETVQRFQGEFGNAPLFLYFKGRVHLLKRDLDLAIEAYVHAKSSGQMEVHLLCTYEIGWASLLKCDWTTALRCYCEMKDQPRWATTLYTYLAGVCNGALGNNDEALNLLNQVGKIKCRRGNPIDLFIVKRAAKCLTLGSVCSTDYVVLILEIVCLWNALVTTPHTNMRRMLVDCSKLRNKNLLQMNCFIEACLHKELGEIASAKAMFDEVITQKRNKKTDELHIIAHAYFELGTLLAERPETVLQGKELLIYVKDKLEDYDLENRLHIRLHGALEQIKSHGVFSK